MGQECPIDKTGHLLTLCPVKDTTLYVQNEVVSIIIDVALGVSLGMLLTGFVFSGRYGIKIRAFKQRIFKRQ